MSEPTKTEGQRPSVERIHLGRGASYLVIQNLGGSAIAVVAFLILSRLITTREMGIWAILQLILAACTTFITWFPQAVTKFVAENASAGSKAKAAGAFYQALRANLVMYVPVIVGFYFGASFLAVRLLNDASYAPLFQVLAFDLIISAGVVPIAAAALLGLKMFKETAVVGLIANGLLRQVFIIALILLTKNFVGLVMGWLLSDAILAVVYVTFVARALGPPKFGFPISKLFHFYLPLEFAQIVYFGQTWIDRALLIVFVPLSALGIYNAAMTAYGVLSNVSVALTKMLFPAFASIRGKLDNRNNLRDAIRLATRYACFTIIPLDLLLLATAKPSMSLLVGNAYISGAAPLAMFCAADAITVFATAVGPSLLALDETVPVGITTGIAVGVGMAVEYALLPHWGVLAASTGRAVIIIIIATLQTLVLRRKTPLQLDLRTVTKTLIAGGVMAVLVTVVQFIYYSKFLLPLYALVGILTYVVMLRLLKTVDKSDVDLIRSMLGGRLGVLTRVLSWVLLPAEQRDS